MEKLTDEQKQAVLDTQLTIKVALVAHICRVIEAATSRGAFKADELTYVGNIYDGLNKAIQDVGKAVLGKTEETIEEVPKDTVTFDEKSVEGTVESS